VQIDVPEALSIERRADFYDGTGAYRDMIVTHLTSRCVPPDSTTETMAAVRVEIDNWRWVGVPFFLRSGKRLGASRQLITLGLRRPTLRMFHTSKRQGPTDRGNEIVIDFADPGSISTGFLAKPPGLEMILGAATMQFRYEDSFCTANDLEGYERLIVEAMLGDQTLFTRDDGVERLWEISSPLLDNPPAVETYRPGSWGPEPSLTRLIAPHRWHLATT
jgi:glucose-6-phosphate 1-dehydrogenase